MYFQSKEGISFIHPENSSKSPEFQNHNLISITPGVISYISILPHDISDVNIVNKIREAAALGDAAASLINSLLYGVKLQSNKLPTNARNAPGPPVACALLALAHQPHTQAA